MSEKIIDIARLRTFYEGFKSLIEGYVEDVKEYIRSYVGDSKLHIIDYAGTIDCTFSANKNDADLAIKVASMQDVKDYVGNSALIIKDKAGNVISNSFTANKKDGDVEITIPTETELGNSLPFVKPSGFGTLFAEEYDKRIEIIADGDFSFAGGDGNTTESAAESADLPTKTNGTATLKFYNTKKTIKGDIYGIYFDPDGIVCPTGGYVQKYKQLNFRFCMHISGKLSTLIGYARYGYTFYLRGANPNNQVNSIDIKGNYGANEITFYPPEYDANGDVNGEATIVAKILVAYSTDTDALKTAMRSAANIYFVLRNTM